MVKFGHKVYRVIEHFFGTRYEFKFRNGYGASVLDLKDSGGYELVPIKYKDENHWEFAYREFGLDFGDYIICLKMDGIKPVFQNLLKIKEYK